ncbi:hypothetical protein [Brachyspira innocens]|uniref:hypothetical protein n=1 Tax=Brachyspira innocens TaxID=13264 RepID=UPI00037127E6|nr:hypothetical protein [Brachyspira innocens]
MEQKIYKNKKDFIQDIIDYNSGFYNNNDYFSIVVSNIHRIIDFNFYLRDILDIISKEKNTSHFYLFFERITFLKKCSISTINDDFTFVSITFIDIKFNKFYFDHNTINFPLSFILCDFNNPVIFILSQITSSMRFNKTNFYEEINFIKFDIIGNCIFELVEIYKSIEFYQAEINNELLFSNAILKNNDAYISFNNYEENNINRLYIINTNLNNKFIFENTNIIQIDLSNTVLNDNVIMINSCIKNCLNSQTARILKNEELKKSNYIKALEYQAEETKLHKEELKEQFKKDKNLKTLGDILSIELSSLYSDNGQNWVKAFIITLLTNLTFFGFYFSIVNNTWHFILSIFIILLLSIKFIKKEIQIYVYLLILIISGIVFGKVPLKIIYDLFIGQSKTSNFLYRFFIFLNPTNYDGLSILSGQNYIKQFFQVFVIF